MDYASDRSSHSGAIPRSGGIAIVLSFCLGILIYYFLHSNYFIEQKAFWGLFIGVIIVAIIGLYDDLMKHALVSKLLSQFIGVAVLISFGLTLNEWTVPFIGKINLGISCYLFTILWVVGITNTYNFMDGLNGMAAGVAVIVAVSFSFITFSRGSGVTAHISYILAASSLGFLIFNYPRASIFMGDVGSAFLGFCFGALAILAAHYDNYHTPFAVMPILLAHFILETLFTFVWRLGHGMSVFQAHKMHPYQLLNQMGVSAKKITLIYYGQTLLLISLCLLYLHSRVEIKFLILFGIVGVYFIYFISVFKAAKARRLI